MQGNDDQISSPWWTNCYVKTVVPKNGLIFYKWLIWSQAVWTISALQQLLYRVLGCEPQGAAVHNFVIQLAFTMCQIYKAVNECTQTFVDKGERLSDFYEMCNSIDIGRGNEFIKIEQPSSSFIQAMEEYLEEAPRGGAVAARHGGSGDEVFRVCSEFNGDYSGVGGMFEQAAQEAERAKFIVEKAEQDKRHAIIRYYCGSEHVPGWAKSRLVTYSSSSVIPNSKDGFGTSSTSSNSICFGYVI
ncbi:hypothetical protein CTI12_AA001950 [Artemisia annua]|uniref:AP180 N-terminal homology (ANTH) domain-containing protein n=1 Tax=Artemisia annua TaxID=35608 RepID=A0A2U1QNT7_ARTAN|nr:hypothetical protein CTI12_AA001950 [Artemisia annua]